MRLLAVGWVVAAVFLVPGAAAADAFVLASRGPLELGADVAAVAPAGRLRVEHGPWTGEGVIEGATGTLTLSTWRVARVRAAGVDVMNDAGEVGSESFRVEDASLRLAFEDEGFTLVVRGGDDAVLRARAPVEGARTPLRIPADVQAAKVPGLPRATPPAPDLVADWEPGWPFAGRYRFASGVVESLPGVHATLDGEGPMRFKLHGGTVSFVDAEGRAHRLATGDATEVGTDGAGTQVWRRLLFEGDITGMDVPLGDYWALAAPGMSWEIDGALGWDRADGWIELDGTRTRVLDEPVALAGRLAFSTSPGRDALGEDTYAGEGGFARVEVAGERLARPPDDVARIASTVAPWAAVAALLAAAAYGLALLYTRLSRRDVVGHPARRRILDALDGDAGLHLRELHRRVGGAWGPVAFHLAILEKQGLVSIHREGHYRVARLSAVAPGAGAAGLRHPTAVRVFGALPAGGEPRTLTQLAAALGVERDVVVYHTRRLADEGRVVLGGEGAARHARRVRGDEPRDGAA